MPSAGGVLRTVLPGSRAALSPVSDATVASLTPKLVAVPGNEIPPGMGCGRLVTPDGAALRYALAPGPSLSKGTVCILQGRAEFIERYFETVRDLRARGYTVATLDWRGQGGSARLLRQSWRGHIRGFRHYDIDLEAFMREIVLPDCPPPFYAIGHSTGGQILLRALRRHRWFSAAVLSSPFLGLGPAPVPPWVIRLIAPLFTMTGLGWVAVPGRGKQALAPESFEGNVLTSDRRRFALSARVLEAEPALGLGAPTIAWLSAALSSMRELYRLKGERPLTAPVLIVAAGADRVVSTEASRNFARQVPGVAAVVVEHARHELLQERDEFRVQFWAAFDAFIGALS
jgi:lysophospholipase